MNNIKDNPVASIVKDILHVCTWYQGRDVDACERVEKYANSLQNAVETNKEQPIIHKCDNCGKQYAQTKACYC